MGRCSGVSHIALSGTSHFLREHPSDTGDNHVGTARQKTDSCLNCCYLGLLILAPPKHFVPESRNRVIVVFLLSLRAFNIFGSLNKMCLAGSHWSLPWDLISCPSSHSPRYRPPSLFFLTLTCRSRSCGQLSPNLPTSQACSWLPYGHLK